MYKSVRKFAQNEIIKQLSIDRTLTDQHRRCERCAYNVSDHCTKTGDKIEEYLAEASSTTNCGKNLTARDNTTRRYHY